MNVSLDNPYEVLSIASVSGSMSLALPKRIIRSVEMKFCPDDFSGTGKYADPTGHLFSGTRQKYPSPKMANNRLAAEWSTTFAKGASK